MCNAKQAHEQAGPEVVDPEVARRRAEEEEERRLAEIRAHGLPVNAGVPPRACHSPQSHSDPCTSQQHAAPGGQGRAILTA